jgi:energy-coupling factor transport system permease protein
MHAFSFRRAASVCTWRRRPTMTTLDRAQPAGAPPRTDAWRTRDILVTAVIGVVFGVVFAYWNFLWTVIAPGAIPPLQAFLIYGVWLVPAVLAPVIVRRPGAAVFAEMVAAGVSTVFGSPWGPDVLLSGFVQGAAAELVFAMTLYRNWSLPVLGIAAVASAAAAWIHDWVLYYADADMTLQIVRAVAMAVSALLIVAGGSYLLERSLRRTGVLDRFGSQTA